MCKHQTKDLFTFKFQTFTNFQTKAKKFDSSVTSYNIENLEANTKYEAWVNPIYGNLEGKLADHFSETTSKIK